MIPRNIHAISLLRIVPPPFPDINDITMVMGQAQITALMMLLLSTVLLMGLFSTLTSIADSNHGGPDSLRDLLPPFRYPTDGGSGGGALQATPQIFQHLASRIFIPLTNTSYRALPAAFGPVLANNGSERANVINGTLLPTKYYSGDVYGCFARDTEVPKPPLNERPFLLLMQRGNCSFAEKVMFAQSLGASAVIVGNNIGSGLIAMSARGSGILIFSLKRLYANRNRQHIEYSHSIRVCVPTDIHGPPRANR